MYVITGATGNIGKVITETLLSKAKKVRVLGRDEKRLKPFVDRGAEARVGSVTEPAFLKAAFQGATAVFTMIPPDPQTPNLAKQQDTIGEAITAALKSAGVSHAVNLSSIGAELESGAGPITGLRRQEDRLKQLDLNVLHLRPGYFMENFLMMIPMIRQMGIVGSAIRGDVPIPMIATRDIGHRVADLLLKPDFKGHSHRYLLGPKNLTMADVTRILGQSIGKPDLPYVAFPYEDAEKGMVAAGLSPDMARNYIEMSRALSEGKIGGYSRTPENTTATTMEEFSSVFAAAYQNA